MTDRIEDLLHYPGQDSRWSDVPETFICDRCGRSWPSKPMAILHYVEAHVQVKHEGWRFLCPICGAWQVTASSRNHVLQCATSHFIRLGKARYPRPGTTVSGG